MSDSDSEVAIPKASKIENTLRAIVARLYKAGSHDELTVKRVRKAAEKQLNLPEDFLKEDASWKSKSKDIIGDEHGKQESEDNLASPDPAKPSKGPVKARAAPNSNKESSKRVTKRPAPETKVKAQKKRRVAPESEDGESALSSLASDTSEEPSKKPSPPKKAPKPRTKKVTKGLEAVKGMKKASQSRKAAVSDEEDEASPKSQIEMQNSAEVNDALLKPQSGRDQESDSDVEINEAPAPAEAPTATADTSESEMSVLIDEEPPPKKKRQKKEPVSKPTKSAKTKAEPRAKVVKPDLSPQEAQVKELQAQLVKCGIRKMWHNELKKCDTSKQKISHLKGMLKEAGMGGRFSESKAKELKERRELEKDMEEAKDYAAKFGAQEEKGRKRLGAKDWGIDESLLGGGEESDSD